MRKGCRTMEWYERATGFWTWARHGRPMTRRWVRESVVERAQEFSAEYIIFGVHIGGYMAFQSDIAPPVPDMEDDVLGQLCEDGHAAGLKVLPYWMTTTGPNTIQLLEHPDWIVKNWEDKGDQVLCYSSPFGDFAEALTREALTKYPVDGMLYDQLTAGRGGSIDLLLRLLSRGVSSDLRPGDATLLPSGQLLRSAHRGGSRGPAAVTGFSDPQCSPFLPTHPARRSTTFGLKRFTFRTGCSAAWLKSAVNSLTGSSVSVTSQPNVNEVALTHRLMRAYGQKPVWGNYSYSYHHHATFRSIESTHMALMDTVASGCSATLLDLNATGRQQKPLRGHEGGNAAGSVDNGRAEGLAPRQVRGHIAFALFGRICS